MNSRQMEIPVGWELLNYDSLASKFKRELSSVEAVSFFDGMDPTWVEAFSDEIPEREIIKQITNSLINSPQNHRPQITLLTGAVGEGKSTALRQTVLRLLKENHYGSIYWHEDIEASLFGKDFNKFINSILGSNEKILFVSDDAEKIKPDILKTVISLSRKSRGNIHFLLCSCDIDWNYIEVNDSDWERNSNFTPFVLEGINDTDAEKLVKAWEFWAETDKKALGNLDNFQNLDEKIQQLIKSGSEIIESGKSQTFLAALLGCRGESIEKRVQTLLHKIRTMTPPNSRRTLLDAYSLVTSLSSENLLILEENILASALGCNRTQELRNSYLKFLGSEVKPIRLPRGNYVVARHRLIAETANKILDKYYFRSPADSLKDLIEHFVKSGNFLDAEDRRIWNKLPHHFSEKGKKLLGISLAEEFVEHQPEAPYPVTDLSKLLRNNSNNKKAVEECRKNFNYEFADAALFQEWGTAERANGNSRLGVWLSFISICDIREPRRKYPGRWMNSLSALAQSFHNLYAENHQLLFLDACASCVRLGLLSHPDERAKENLERNGDFCIENGKDYKFMDKGDAFAKLLKGVEVAFDEKEKDNLFEPLEFPKNQVPTLKDLKYTGFLLQFLG